MCIRDRLGHEVFVTAVSDLSVINGQAWAKLAPLTLNPVELVNGHWQVTHPWYEVGTGQWQNLTTCQAVFMRKDPPVTVPICTLHLF